MFMPYAYSRPYVYSFWQTFQALWLFPALRLFQTLEYITNFFIEIPPCGKKVILSTEFVLLDLNPPFYEVNQEVWKRPPAWRNFKNIFCVLSKYPKKPFRTEKSSIFNFQYVKEVWATGLLGVKDIIECFYLMIWPLFKF